VTSGDAAARAPTPWGWIAFSAQAVVVAGCVALAYAVDVGLLVVLPLVALALGVVASVVLILVPTGRRAGVRGLVGVLGAFLLWLVVVAMVLSGSQESPFDQFGG
jgi:hypothetical protein